MKHLFTEERAGGGNEQEIGKLLMIRNVGSHDQQQPVEAKERLSSLSPGRPGIVRERLPGKG